MQTADAYGSRTGWRVLLIFCSTLLPFFAIANEVATTADLPTQCDQPRLVTLYQGATDSAVALGITPLAWLTLAGKAHLPLFTRCAYQC